MYCEIDITFFSYTVLVRSLPAVRVSKQRGEIYALPQVILFSLRTLYLITLRPTKTTLYIRNISEIIASLINKSIFTVGYRCLNKMNRIIKIHKDQIEHDYKNNIVYKIYCQNCDASYVGQTKRQLKTRIKEHYNNNIRLDKSRHTVVT